MLDEGGLGVGHGRLAGRAKVAQVQVQQVVVQSGDAAPVQLSFEAVVKIGAQFLGGVDDGVAPVVLLQYNGHGLVAEEDHIDVVAFVIGRHIFGVDADPLAGDKALELVLDVVQVAPGHHFVSDQEQAA